MSQIVLTLGGVPFRDFEVPEKISFGGAQRLAVNELIGGGRVVNVLGAAESEISFHGIFSGDDAAGRADLLDAARATGVAVPLVWGDFFFQVVLAEFAAEYTKPWWIPFAVRCVVVSDLAAAIADVLAPAVNLIGGDLAAAAGFSPQAGVNLTMLGVSSLAEFAGVQGLVSGGVAVQGGAVLNAAAGVNNAVDAASGVAAVQQLGAASSTLAGLAAVGGYINRAAANIAGQLL